MVYTSPSVFGFRFGGQHQGFGRLLTVELLKFGGYFLNCGGARPIPLLVKKYLSQGDYRQTREQL
jgi:hypothetical protein